jgi:hypothetical protein
MIKLCYKEYPYKMSLKACKVFFDQTGLDLQTVFMKYIVACSETRDLTPMGRLVYFAEIQTRDIACKALHAVIKQEDGSVPIAEIEDATYRVGWAMSDDDSGMREPWPIVMLQTALEINDYFSSGEVAKKSDTLAQSKKTKSS